MIEIFVHTIFYALGLIPFALESIKVTEISRSKILISSYSKNYSNKYIIIRL